MNIVPVLLIVMKISKQDTLKMSASHITFPRTKYTPTFGDTVLRNSDMTTVKKTVWIISKSANIQSITPGMVNFFAIHGMKCEYCETVTPCFEVTGTIYQYSTSFGISFKYILSSRHSAFDGRTYTRERDMCVVELSVPSILFNDICAVMGFVNDECFLHSYVDSLDIPEDDFAVLQPVAPFVDIPFSNSIISIDTVPRPMRIGKDCAALERYGNYAQFYFIENSEIGFYEALKHAKGEDICAYVTYPVTLYRSLVERLTENTTLTHTFHSSLDIPPTSTNMGTVIMDPRINRKINMYVDFDTLPKPKRAPPRSSVPTVSTYLPNKKHPKSIAEDMIFPLEIYIDMDDETVNYSHNLGVIPIKFEWDFGDGYESCASRPAHRYLNSGEYLVRLRAWVISGNVVKILLAEKPVIV